MVKKIDNLYRDVILGIFSGVVAGVVILLSQAYATIITNSEKLRNNILWIRIFTTIFATLFIGVVYFYYKKAKKGKK